MNCSWRRRHRRNKSWSMGAHKSWELNFVQLAALNTSISFQRSQIHRSIARAGPEAEAALLVFACDMFLFFFEFQSHQRFCLDPHLFSNRVLFIYLSRVCIGWPSGRTPRELCGSCVGPAQTFQFRPPVIIAQMRQDPQFVQHVTLHEKGKAPNKTEDTTARSPQRAETLR